MKNSISGDVLSGKRLSRYFLQTAQLKAKFRAQAVKQESFVLSQISLIGSGLIVRSSTLTAAR
jgi:hypothetical protein